MHKEWGSRRSLQAWNFSVTALKHDPGFYSRLRSSSLESEPQLEYMPTLAGLTKGLFR